MIAFDKIGWDVQKNAPHTGAAAPSKEAIVHLHLSEHRPIDDHGLSPEATSKILRGGGGARVNWMKTCAPHPTDANGPTDRSAKASEAPLYL